MPATHVDTYIIFCLRQTMSFLYFYDTSRLSDLFQAAADTLFSPNNDSQMALAIFVIGEG